MTRLLIPSDHLSIRSDEHSESIRPSPTKTAPQTVERFATTRPYFARLVDRDLQAVRSAELSLSRWSGAWPEAISGDQSAWRASPQGICTKCHLRAGCSMAQQFSPAARCTQRGLRNQRRTPAPTRGSRIDRYGPGIDRPRLCQSGCHCRRHGRVLSRRRRSTVRSGGAQ